MVVELTDEELVIIAEAINLYNLTLIDTRDAYNAVKNETFKESEIIELQSEIDLANDVIKVSEELLKKLNLEGYEFH